MRSRFAKVVLTAATLQDILLWTLLAFATSLNSGARIDTVQIGGLLTISMVFVVMSVWLGSTLLRWIDRTIQTNLSASDGVALSLVGCLGLSAIASLLHINVTFGALIAGFLVGNFFRGNADTKQGVSYLATSFFVPVYFAIVGLKIDLPNQLNLSMTMAFILISSAFKLTPVFIAMQFAGKSIPVATSYSIAMNTRGGPGIVLASIALSFEIITEAFFVTLVTASIVTTLVTGIWLRLMLRWSCGRELTCEH